MPLRYGLGAKKQILAIFALQLHVLALNYVPRTYGGKQYGPPLFYKKKIFYQISLNQLDKIIFVIKQRYCFPLYVREICTKIWT